MSTIGKVPFPYKPLININGALYFPEPYSSLHLDNGKRNGMVSIASLATLSVASTLCLITFIILRMISWQGHYRTWVGYNQYVVLVLSLLLADLQQSSGFLISWFWIRIDMIVAPSTPCFAQGWLLHSGDVSSGFFVLSIALHTYYTAVHGKRVGNKTFAAIVFGIWAWSYFLTGIGVMMHGHKKYFTAAGSWCWVSPAYETERLWTHYVWIFAIEFSTIIIYFITFCCLRKKTRRLSITADSAIEGPAAATIKAVNRIAMLMMLYPLVYLLLTLPLSAGRMWTMSDGTRATSNLYTSIAGGLLTSCGWVDTLLYSLTRKRLLSDTMPRTATARNSINEEGISKSNVQMRKVVVSGSTMDFDLVSPETIQKDAPIAHELFERTASFRSNTHSMQPILSRLGSFRGRSERAKLEVIADHKEIAQPDMGPLRLEVMLPDPPGYGYPRPNRDFWRDCTG